MKPLISILMANFNKEKYLTDAITSVINQSDSRWELVIVDDCSTDKSMKVIKKISKDDNRIRIYKNPKNRGTAYTQDRLIKLASADIVGILDSDDALTKDAVKVILSAYKLHRECGFIYSQFAYANETLEVYKIGECAAIPKGESNLTSDCVSHFKTFRKALYKRIEGYRADLSPAEDMDIVLKLEEVTKFHFVDEILYLYRMLTSSYSHGNIRADKGRLGYLTAVGEASQRRMGTKIIGIPRSQLINKLVEGLILSIKLGDYNRLKYFIKILWL